MVAELNFLLGTKVACRSYGLWYYLWGYLQKYVYSHSLNTDEEFKDGDRRRNSTNSNTFCYELIHHLLNKFTSGSITV